MHGTFIVTFFIFLHKSNQNDSSLTVIADESENICTFELTHHRPDGITQKSKTDHICLSLRSVFLHLGNQIENNGSQVICKDKH